MKRVFQSLAVATLLLTQPVVAWSCPLCKYALESNDLEPRAYMISILFMIGTISTLFLSMAGLLWWVTRLEKKNLTEAGYEHLFQNAGSMPYATEVDPKQG